MLDYEPEKCFTEKYGIEYKSGILNAGSVVNNSIIQMRLV